MYLFHPIGLRDVTHSRIDIFISIIIGRPIISRSIMVTDGFCYCVEHINDQFVADNIALEHEVMIMSEYRYDSFCISFHYT